MASEEERDALLRRALLQALGGRAGERAQLWIELADAVECDGGEAPRGGLPERAADLDGRPMPPGC